MCSMTPVFCCSEKLLWCHRCICPSLCIFVVFLLICAAGQKHTKIYTHSSVDFHFSSFSVLFFVLLAKNTSHSRAAAAFTAAAFADAAVEKSLRNTTNWVRSCAR